MIFSFLPGSAQDRCGTEANKLTLQGQQGNQPGDAVFEQWLKAKAQAQMGRSSTGRSQSTYQVPVVVHVIHNGVNDPTNISDAQILSQIKVLNADYKRLNADASKTPSDFQSVAGAFDVEFVLARQDPNGLETTGIVRMQGPKTAWTVNDNYQLKALSYWPAEDYLNLWVCNLTDYLGYSQFPVSNLQGLENASKNRLTDGVVIAYNAFGSKDDDVNNNFTLLSKYNKGRTATHEIGHFFGLRHIWGDDGGSCSGDDYVADTPNQPGSTSGCPSHPQNNSCGTITMFQNYLDYTDDNCMNLFTKGQVSRMETVINNSIRRASLLTSPGLSEPVPQPNDVSLIAILAPGSGACQTGIVPQIHVRNNGNNTITSTQVSFQVDGNVQETKTFTLNLAPGDESTLSFSMVSFGSGTHDVLFSVIQTNGTTDGNPNNNSAEQSVLVPASIATPFTETFDAFPSDWTIQNPDNRFTWTLANAPAASTDNMAMKLEFYNYADNLGDIDLLISPVFDLSSAPVSLLTFDVAYSVFSGSSDGLKVVVLTDCNTDINQGTVVYDKSGSALATAPATSNAFTPNGAGQWRTETVNLRNFIGKSHVQIAFVSVNDWGNNLYLDNIRVLTTPFQNLTARQITAPSPVTCATQVNPVIRVRNSGTDISSFTVQYTVNGTTSSVDQTDLTFEGGTEMDVTLPAVTLKQGSNTLSVTLTNPNGKADLDPSDNTITATTLVNASKDYIPLRENFETATKANWTIANPTGGQNWNTTMLGNNTVLYVNAYANTTLGDQAWFASPVLDFSGTDRASMFFDLAYVGRNDITDKLQIFASTDCGNTFGRELRNYVGSTLSDTAVSSSWRPTREKDWHRKYVNLDNLAGLKNVRLAFVFTNSNGNNLYIDNIEIFLSDTPNPVESTTPMSVYPNPTTGDFSVTFNFAERQEDVVVDVMDVMGRTLISQPLTNVLNQTLPVILENPSTGVYLVRARAGSKKYVSRVIVVR
jgi:hypothetical protein